MSSLRLCNRTRLELLALALAAITACTFPELPPIAADGPVDDAGVTDAAVDSTVDARDDAMSQPTYAVEGVVTGMWSGAAVVLELTASPAPPERITVSDNGSFSFPTGLPSGRTFTLAVPTDGHPFMHTCTVLNPNGMVVDSDVTDRQVSCAPQVSMSVAFTAPVVVPFEVAIPTYSEIEAATPVQESRIVVTAPAATALTINGNAVTSGALSGVVSLRAPLSIHVAVGAISQEYTFTFDRSGDSLHGPLYAKSSNSGAGDQQGIVSSSGDLVAVGAPLEDSSASGVNQNQNDESSADSGAVYIYRRVGQTWTQEAYLKPSVNQAGARFGASVSLYNEGTTAILAVGAPRFDGSGGVDSGSVFIFRRSSAGAWSEEQRIEGSPLSGDADFGASVSINRSSPSYAIAVGSPRYATDHGAVHVFRYTSGTWNQEKFLNAPNFEANDGFGTRVSIHGSLLAVGAPGEDSDGVGVNPPSQSSNAAMDSGAVYVYTHSANDWQLTTYLKASNTGAGDAFGTSVSIENNVLVVGAPREDSDGTNQTNNNYPDAGAAYVFELNAGTWSQLSYLKIGSNIGVAEFGGDVCVHGALVAVGGTERLGAQGATGLARYFERAGGAGGFDAGSAILRAGNAEEGDEYGASVSLSGEGLFVGAPMEDSNARGFNTGLANNAAPNSGAVYGYY